MPQQYHGVWTDVGSSANVVLNITEDLITFDVPSSLTGDVIRVRNTRTFSNPVDMGTRSYNLYFMEGANFHTNLLNPVTTIVLGGNAGDPLIKILWVNTSVTIQLLTQTTSDPYGATTLISSSSGVIDDSIDPFSVLYCLAIDADNTYNLIQLGINDGNGWLTAVQLSTITPAGWPSLLLSWDVTYFDHQVTSQAGIGTDYLFLAYKQNEDPTFGLYESREPLEFTYLTEGVELPPWPQNSWVITNVSNPEERSPLIYGYVGLVDNKDFFVTRLSSSETYTGLALYKPGCVLLGSEANRQFSLRFDFTRAAPTLFGGVIRFAYGHNSIWDGSGSQEFTRYYIEVRADFIENDPDITFYVTINDHETTVAVHQVSGTFTIVDTGGLQFALLVDVSPSQQVNVKLEWTGYNSTAFGTIIDSTFQSPVDLVEGFGHITTKYVSIGINDADLYPTFDGDTHVLSRNVAASLSPNHWATYPPIESITPETGETVVGNWRVINALSDGFAVVSPYTSNNFDGALIYNFTNTDLSVLTMYYPDAYTVESGATYVAPYFMLNWRQALDPEYRSFELNLYPSDEAAGYRIRFLVDSHPTIANTLLLSAALLYHDALGDETVVSEWSDINFTLPPYLTYIGSDHYGLALAISVSGSSANFHYGGYSDQGGYLGTSTATSEPLSIDPGLLPVDLSNLNSFYITRYDKENILNTAIVVAWDKQPDGIDPNLIPLGWIDPNSFDGLGYTKKGRWWAYDEVGERTTLVNGDILGVNVQDSTNGIYNTAFSNEIWELDIGSTGKFGLYYRLSGNALLDTYPGISIAGIYQLSNNNFVTGGGSIPLEIFTGIALGPAFGGFIYALTVTDSNGSNQIIDVMAPMPVLNTDENTIYGFLFDVDGTSVVTQVVAYTDSAWTVVATHSLTLTQTVSWDEAITLTYSNSQIAPADANQQAALENQDLYLSEFLTQPSEIYQDYTPLGGTLIMPATVLRVTVRDESEWKSFYDPHILVKELLSFDECFIDIEHPDIDEPFVQLILQDIPGIYYNAHVTYLDDFIATVVAENLTPVEQVAMRSLQRARHLVYKDLWDYGYRADNFNYDVDPNGTEDLQWYPDIKITNENPTLPGPQLRQDQLIYLVNGKVVFPTIQTNGVVLKDAVSLLNNHPDRSLAVIDFIELGGFERVILNSNNIEVISTENNVSIIEITLPSNGALGKTPMLIAGGNFMLPGDDYRMKEVNKMRVRLDHIRACTLDTFRDPDDINYVSFVGSGVYNLSTFDPVAYLTQGNSAVLLVRTPHLCTNRESLHRTDIRGAYTHYRVPMGLAIGNDGTILHYKLVDWDKGVCAIHATRPHLANGYLEAISEENLDYYKYIQKTTNLRPDRAWMVDFYTI